jgi:hypothetical protein
LLKLQNSFLVHKMFIYLIDYYTIVGNRNAWYDVKVNFNYDYMMCQVKNEYKDTFNRVMTVIKIQ